MTTSPKHTPSKLETSINLEAEKPSSLTWMTASSV